MDIRKVYGDWLEERRLTNMRPLPGDSHYHIMTVIERWEAVEKAEKAERLKDTGERFRIRPQNTDGSFGVSVVICKKNPDGTIWINPEISPEEMARGFLDHIAWLSQFINKA